MTFTLVDAAALAAEPGPHPAASPYDKRVSEALGLTAFEMYRVELPPGAETVAHDHLDDGVEDAYAFVAGSGWLVVDGEEVPVRPGQFVAVTVESRRQVRAGPAGLDLVAVCAAPR